METVEVITYGGGSYYRDIFQAVALLAGTGGISSLIRLALVLGLMMGILKACLLYTSPSPRDQRGSRMPSSA